MNQLLTRLAKIEEENHRLRSENDRFKSTLEDTNVTLKDEFCRFEKEIKGLKQTIIRQNDQIISLAARVGAQEANRVSFKLYSQKKISPKNFWFVRNQDRNQAVFHFLKTGNFGDALKTYPI